MRLYNTLCNSGYHRSHHATPNAIHGSFNVAFHQVPVGPALRKLINFLHTPDPMEPISIGYDRRKLLCVGRVDQVDLRQLAEGLEIEQKLIVPQSLDEFKVVVHIAAEEVSTVQMTGVKKRMTLT